MNFDWITHTNPVALWWIFLVTASLGNILFWSWTKLYLYKDSPIKTFNFTKFERKNIIWFSAFYVFGCAYRSFFVKADVQKICVFDTWFSSVFLGRSVATIAEIAFVIQWAIVLKYIGNALEDDFIKKISKVIVPVIVVAECFSWYAVITTHYLGNSIEESLWTVTYFFILLALIKMSPYFKGIFKYAVRIAIFSDILYLLFMIFVDVRMYVTRLIEDTKNNKTYLGFYEGLVSLNTKWVVTHDINEWHTEIPWMTLYFSFAVLVSICLCYVPLSRDELKKHLK